MHGFATHPSEDELELYLLRRLSPHDTEQIEDHSMCCAGCLACLEATDDFIETFKIAQRQISGESHIVVGIRARRLWNFCAAVAAAAVLFAIGLEVGMNYRISSIPSISQSGPAMPTIVFAPIPAPATRSQANSPNRDLHPRQSPRAYVLSASSPQMHKRFRAPANIAPRPQQALLDPPSILKVMPGQRDPVSVVPPLSVPPFRARRNFLARALAVLQTPFKPHPKS